MFFQRNGNAVTLLLPLVPKPEDAISVYHLIEELQAIEPQLAPLPALQTFLIAIEAASGESLPPTLLT